jgi:hypothetical protein
MMKEGMAAGWMKDAGLMEDVAMDAWYVCIGSLLHV